MHVSTKALFPMLTQRFKHPTFHHSQLSHWHKRTYSKGEKKYAPSSIWWSQVQLLVSHVGKFCPLLKAESLVLHIHSTCYHMQIKDQHLEGSTILAFFFSHFIDVSREHCPYGTHFKTQCACLLPVHSPWPALRIGLQVAVNDCSTCG